MQLTVTMHGSIAAIEPAGSIDARASLDFKRLVLERLAGGTRQFVIDLAQVDHMTGEGIRVLLMLALKLKDADGALVICSLNEQMRRAFEVSGFNQFQFAVSRSEALAQLSAAAGRSPAAPTRASSKLSRLTARLLDDTVGPPRSAQPPPAPPSELAKRVALLLTTAQASQPQEPPKTRRGTGSRIRQLPKS